MLRRNSIKIISLDYVISHMTNVTLSVPPELAKKMKKHPEVRWSEVARQAIADHLEFLDLLNKATDPLIKEKEFAELAVKIQHKRRKSTWRSYLKG